MICVITGAAGGIGSAASVELAARGHTVVLVGRDRAKLERTADRVTSVSGSRPDILTCDYASFAEVRKLAAELLDRYERIDVLAHNAGVMTPRRQTTVDGHELIMQVNHLSPFLLTTLLLDRLHESGARIVTTASMAARTGRIDPDDLDRRRRWWNGWLQYGDSKQANVLFTAHLARLGKNIYPTCFHPGIIRTNFASDTAYMRFLMMIPGLARSPEEGARGLVHLATHPDGTAYPGRYFVRTTPARASANMTDPELARRLWAASLAATSA
ncbi:retinol dehydrogenase [Thermopolyspora flexuosa]|jgi:NAD(P)-dependent dehydrogenase (short-subunit alcohol dehydrogenase family)|uniref:Short-subunit dehydrogenase n=1 Tax=Thermopolyspora flexuosa TaxID=103836 RepID=A0A543J4Q8_9ACTN|nr:SDR family NAD(P)-dependent oxidoreductase [Thermopolyspora flexuosa]TQM77758.1 short-subunit dehydrogenase [Thermopolyspora flexuosa]GGM70891.1 retinol dehydrogenase [Thermopolyspora flexuosa]